MKIQIYESHQSGSYLKRSEALTARRSRPCMSDIQNFCTTCLSLMVFLNFRLLRFGISNIHVDFLQMIQGIRDF